MIIFPRLYGNRVVNARRDFRKFYISALHSCVFAEYSRVNAIKRERRASAFPAKVCLFFGGLLLLPGRKVRLYKVLQSPKVGWEIR